MYRGAFRFPVRRYSSVVRGISMTMRAPEAGIAAHLALATRDITTVVLPSLSPTMETGVIAEWKKQPGDVVQAGDIMCDIDTDKASVGFEMQDECVLAKILVDAHATELPVGSPIALVVEDLDEYAAFLKMDPSEQMAGVVSSSSGGAVAATELPAEQTAQATPASPAALTNDSSLPVRLSPAARHMVESMRLDPGSISVDGSTRFTISKFNKLVRKGDVIRAVQAGQASPAAAKSTPASASAAPVAVTPTAVSTAVQEEGSGYVDIPNNNIRKVIAKRLLESKLNVPHSYASHECKIDALMRFRKTLKEDLGVNVSVNDLIIKAAALSLRDVPAANSRFDPASGSVKAPIQSAAGGAQIDISVAVATPTGLITPIVFGADRRGLADINNTVKDLAGRAKDGKLKPEEFQGGSFTISNLGMFGISEFTAVINPPQACILAVGGGIPRVSVRDGRPAVETTLTVQMSSDRRVVDDATAALFLETFSSYLSNPMKMML